MAEDKPVVHIDQSEKRSGLPEVDQGGRCPHCGGPTSRWWG